MQSSGKNYKLGKGAIQDLLFFLVLIMTAAFLLWKCQYGIGNLDETFYLTVPHRLLAGDALFQHEWHLSQMAGFLLMPIYSVVRALNGGMEGIVLAMRYAAILFQCALAIAIYCRLRSYNWLGAACATLSFLLYIPFSIMALSYNSMGIFFLVLACVFHLPVGKRQTLADIFAGLCFAASVLCCPYLASLFVIYALVVAVHYLQSRNKEARCVSERRLCRRFCAFAAGIALLAGMFLAFVLSRSSFEAVWNALPQILNDPEHPSFSMVSRLKEYVKSVVFATSVSPESYGIILVLFVCCALDRNRRQRKLPYFGLSALCTIILMVSHYRALDYINMTLWSVNVIAPFVWLLSDKKKVRTIFYGFWIPGIAYSFCLNLSSNQQFFAITSAGSVATVASILMLGIFLNEIHAWNFKSVLKTSTLVLGCFILVIQLVTQTDLRYRQVFWEPGLADQTVRIDQGIQAGLAVSPWRAEEYDSDLQTVERMDIPQGTKVLFLSSKPQLYLFADCEMASYSGWLSGVNEAATERLIAYYQLNPDKWPEMIYADLKHEEYVQIFVENFSYERTAFSDGIVLKRSAENEM